MCTVLLFVCPQLIRDNCDVKMYYKLDGVLHRKDVYLQNLKVYIYIAHAIANRHYIGLTTYMYLYI